MYNTEFVRKGIIIMADYESNIIETADLAPINTHKDDKFQTLKTLIVSSAHMVHDTYAGFFAPLLPYLIERMSLLKVEAGMFLFVYQSASILQPVIGHLGDKTNLRKYALIMPAITGIALSLLGTAPTFTFGLMLCLIAGISSASMHSILPALVAKLSGKQVGKGMSFWMVGGEIGIMLGPLMVATIIAAFTIKATPWLMIPGIAVSIALSILLKDMPHHNANPNSQAKIPMKEMLAILLPLAGVMLMRSLLRTASEIYLPLYLIEEGVNPFLAGSSVSLLLGFGVLGTIVGGILKDKYGFKKVMLISIIFASLGMIFFTKTTGFLQVASLALLGTTSMVVLPVGLAFVQESFPNNRSLANGFYLAIVFALNAVAGVTTGFMYDKIGGNSTFLVSGLISFLGIPFIFLLPKESKPAKN
jgi:FSR family fosmidomycin resistance protein-like MFS transporter